MNTFRIAGRDSHQDISTNAMLIAVFGIAGAAGLLWVGGAVAAVVTGHGVHHSDAMAGLQAAFHPDQPSRAWHTAMPGPLVYWLLTAAVLAVAAGIAVAAWMLWRANGTRRSLHSMAGLATRREVRAHGSSNTLLTRAAIVRPSLSRPTPRDVGYRLGTSRGIPVWVSVEDSLLILGPPRSGKGLHLVVPMLLGAPGAVVTTSTRPDNVAATHAAREHTGPVAVFDPQGLAPRLVATTRWSPIRGCDDPQTAMIRAGALSASASDQVESRSFWQAQTEAALRAFLHAAALDGRGAVDLYRWSLDPAAAGEVVRILNAADHSAPGWADALEAIINGDPRTRDNSWAGVRVALSSLADPRVLNAVSPPEEHDFDPNEFLTDKGILYLLGTAAGSGAAANLISAFIEDLVDVARRRAANSPNTRLDPPLALILDEAANYALPSLPALISEGGGTGITTVAVLQSLAQARARWGEHEGAAIWDAASVKIVLGGGSNARDLHDMSALIGERDEPTETASRDAGGRRTRSTSIRRIPILDPSALRRVPFGDAILLLRTASPIILNLEPWTNRRTTPAM